MEKKPKFVLPSPNFNKKANKDELKPKYPYLTPCGMTLLPRQKQPPPMYGKRGATVPSKFLFKFQQQKVNANQMFHKNAQQTPITARAAPAPPPEYHFCKICVMEFQSKHDLHRHLSQHENCPVEDCDYIGHPTKMDAHVIKFHYSGIYEKVRKMNTPEEIAAWRDERKNRYPTLKNIIQNQRAKEQRLKRGERLEQNKCRFGKPEIRQRAKERHFNKNAEAKEQTKVVANEEKKTKKRLNNIKRRQKRRDYEHKKVQVKQGKKVEDDVEKKCFGIRMFRGTGDMENYKHVKSRKPETTNALVNLLGMYGSDDDDDDNDDDSDSTVNDNVNNDESITIERNSELKDLTENNQCLNKEIVEVELKNVNKFKEIPLKETQQTSTTHNVETSNESDNEAPDEMPISRVSDIPSPTPCPSSETANNEIKVPKQQLAKSVKLKSAPKRQRIQRKSGLNYRLSYKQQPNTLLEKLLETEIRHERNVLLQCVRFVCENNFFDLGSSKQKKLLN